MRGLAGHVLSHSDTPPTGATTHSAAPERAFQKRGDFAEPSAAGVPEAARTQRAGLPSQIDMQAGDEKLAADHAMTVTLSVYDVNGSLSAPAQPRSAAARERLRVRGERDALLTSQSLDA